MLKIFTNFKTQEDFSFLYPKFKDKPITIFNDKFPSNLEDLKLNPYNILIIHEPNEFFDLHNLTIKYSHIFSAILTWSDLILKNCSNAIWFDHGARNEDNEWIKSFENTTSKKFEISFLSGAKKLSEGHLLRQEIYRLEEKIIIPKKWFYVLEDFDWDDFNKGGIGRSKGTNTATFNNLPKRICYNDSMFNIAVENVKHNNWYTEKLGDALASKTVPIYWGCPNIGEFFDKKGIITFETKEELIDIINSLTPELYESMLPHIENNYKLVYNSYFPYTLENILTQIIELNNI